MNFILFTNQNALLWQRKREKERKVDEKKKKKRTQSSPPLTAPLKQLFGGQRRGNRELALILTTSFEVRFIVMKRFADQTRIQASLKTHLSISHASPYISKRRGTRARKINATLRRTRKQRATRRHALTLPFFSTVRSTGATRAVESNLKQKLGGEQRESMCVPFDAIPLSQRRERVFLFFVRRIYADERRE